jgi:hypothetical protein
MAQDSATAEALFKRALQDMDAGRLDAACPVFAESYRIDSRPGTLFTLAECEAQAGKLASAIAHYSDYLQMFSRMPSDQKLRQQGRDKVADAQLLKLIPLVPQLVLILPADAPEGTTVRRDDVVLQRPSLGIPLPVDPGDHVITTQVPGGVVRSVKVTIAQGEVKRVELVVDQPIAMPAGSSARSSPLRADPPLVLRSDRPATGSAVAPSSQRVWAYILGGLAIEGLAVGAVTGLMAYDKKQIVSRECVGNLCTPDGKSAGDSAHTLGLVSTMTFGVGLASLAGAIVLWTTDRPSREIRIGTVRVQPVMNSGTQGALVGVRGGF